MHRTLNQMGKLLLGSALALASIAALAATAGPWLLYGLALNYVPSRPTVPTTEQLTVEQFAELRLKYQLGDQPLASDMPHWYVWRVLEGVEARRTDNSMPTHPAAIRVAAVLASDYIHGIVSSGNSAVAQFGLSLWLTRNWTEQQMLAQLWHVHAKRSASCSQRNRVWDPKLGCKTRDVVW
jgi:hypothetical protein